MPPVTLVLPPLTQLNTPYPSTAYLTHFLRGRGVAAEQLDLGIELVDALFCREGLARVFDALGQIDALPEEAWRALALADRHLHAVDPVMAFLRGADSGLALLLLHSPLIPQGPATGRFDAAPFGPMGTADAARHLATLYLQDLVSLVQVLDPGFGLARYQHHLAIGAASYDPLHQRLQQTTLVDAALDALTDARLPDVAGRVVGLSVPFPGNLYGALRIGRRLKARGATVLMGGGYVNTELREVDEPRLWACVDGLTYDDGEGPLLAWLEYLDGGPDQRHRTRTAEGPIERAAVPQPFTVAGTYDGLPLDRYLQLVDTLNPAHRLWADGRWNKITLAHGCYWRKCSFCDVHLDYVGGYHTTSVGRIVDEMERLVVETGQRGFHFVDEAAPPKVLVGVARELLARGLAITWWGNIRFEKAFTPDVCRLLAASGLVMVTGGLEVACDRLLERIRKGVTVEQVVRAAHAFEEAGVRVHAYLMYGFPTQTDQESIDAMEVVRQLFSEKVLSSAFWHRFVLTRHAPIFRDLEAFGVTLPPEAEGPRFAANDLPHLDPQGGDHDAFDAVLPRALRAWMQGDGVERPVTSWFDVPMPPSTMAPDRVRAALIDGVEGGGSRLLWLGGTPLETDDGVHLHTADGVVVVPVTGDVAEWLCEVLEAAVPGSDGLRLHDAVDVFPGAWKAFEGWWSELRRVGLLCLP